MSRRHWISVATVAVLSAGCGVDGVFGSRSTQVSPDALATRSCGPLDGPAIAIYLAPVPVTSLPPTTPYIVVSVWALDALWNSWSWTLTENEEGGSVLYASEAAEWEFAKHADLTLTAVAPDSSMRGYVDARFPSAGRVRGEFDAVWTPQDPEKFWCG